MVIKRETKEIPLSKITISPLHFEREHTAEQVAKMVESIQDAGGVINMPTVRKSGKVYELLAGKRRLTAMKILHFRQARFDVVTCDDNTAEMLSIKENLDGTDPLSPTDKIRAVERAMVIARDRITARPDRPDPARLKNKKTKVRSDPDPEDHDDEETDSGVTEMQVREAAAKDLGVSPTTVNQTLKLKNLVPAALRAYEKKRISKQQAVMLSGLSPSEQHKKLPKILRESQRETSNRESLEKLSKDPDYKVSMREVGKLGNHCDAARLIAEALDKTMSAEVAADIEEEFMSSLDQTIVVLERLRQNIKTMADWAGSAKDDK